MRVLRIVLWVLLISALWLAGQAVQAGQASAKSPPHIIYLLADDLGWAGVGYEKVFPFLKTPHLDEMARVGVRFERFYAAAPWCSPTRVSIMTGRYPARYNSHKPGDGLPSEATTIAEILRRAGYRTAHYGKWHLGKAAPRDQGYDDSMWTGNNMSHVDPTYVDHKGNKQKHKGEDCEILVDKTIEFLRQGVKEGKPCFVTVWYHVPHGPDGTTPPFIEMYKNLPKEKDRVFWGQISALDASIGKLRAALRELGIAGNTLIVFCGDNGGVGGTSGPLRAAKGSVYEGGFRVPGVLEWPARFPQPVRVAARCCTTDLLPTALDAAGASFPKDAPPPDGMSLLPIIEKGLTERPAPLFFYQPPGHDYTRTDGRFVTIAGKMKLISNLRGEHELYDLDADPKEKTSIADEHPRVVTELEQSLNAWADSVERDLGRAKK